MRCCVTWTAYHTIESPLFRYDTHFLEKAFEYDTFSKLTFCQKSLQIPTIFTLLIS